jgi:hypothetical protein
MIVEHFNPHSTIRNETSPPHVVGFYMNQEDGRGSPPLKPAMENAYYNNPRRPKRRHPLGKGENQRREYFIHSHLSFNLLFIISKPRFVLSSNIFFNKGTSKPLNISL